MERGGSCQKGEKLVKAWKVYIMKEIINHRIGKQKSRPIVTSTSSREQLPAPDMSTADCGLI